MTIKKKLYASALKVICSVVGDDAAKKFDVKLRDNKMLNLKVPKTLSDKVSFLELHDRSPLASLCTDKYEVRKYIAQKGLANIIIPLACDNVWSKPEDIDFDILPDSFVLKATHGCKMNLIVRNKIKLDIDKAQKEIKRWFKTTYGTYSMEPHYIGIPHRVYAEKYLNSPSGLTDYKFHCLNGIPSFVLTVSDRIVYPDKPMKVTLDMYDMTWKPIKELKPAGNEIPGSFNMQKPALFEEMVLIAQRLSEDFKFVRVDLYEHEGKVYFGELTFTPAHCAFPYFTDEFDKEMGKLLKI